MIGAYITQLQQGKSLSGDQAAHAFRELLSGTAPEHDAAAFLLALKSKGESIEEIVAAATILREQMVPATAPENAIDVCGTGGDTKGTYNISTAVAFVVAACGVNVAKHGNRAVSSQAGSTDVLEAMGIRPATTPDEVTRCFDSGHLCFIAAPAFHPALASVAALRKKLATRTIFNLLGPLCNPACVKHQLVGVYEAKRVHPMAEALKALGSQSAWVAHGECGLDELSICGSSVVAALAHGGIRVFEISPLAAHLPTHSLEALVGGDARQNAAALLALLEGHAGAYRDAVLLNAAAALMVAEQVSDLASGALLAAEAIDSGRALNLLERMRA